MRSARRGFSLIELLVSVAILGVLSTLAVPNLVRAHYKGRAARIADDLRVLRDTFDQYHMTAGEWPRSRGWGIVPPELRSVLPAGVTFDLTDWQTRFAFTNYSGRSDAWKSKRGYSVVLRARIDNIMLANMLYSLAPNLFAQASINKKRGVFFVVLE